MSWGDRAECKKEDYDPETWVPSGSPKRSAQVQDAIRICRKVCTVRQQCAQEARATGQSFGVWGGVDLGYSGTVSERAWEQLRAVAEGMKA